MRLISVEPGLHEVKAHLAACGYEVEDMHTCIRPVEAVIFSGQTVTADRIAPLPCAEGTVLVNATGLTPAEVASQLDARLS